MFAINKDIEQKMLDPDSITLLGEAKHTQKPVLQFIKQMEDKIFVVKEVRTITSQKKKKISRLVFHTMYKTKAPKMS